MSELRELRQLREDNRKLKGLVADLSLDKTTPSCPSKQRASISSRYFSKISTGLMIPCIWCVLVFSSSLLVSVEGQSSVQEEPMVGQKALLSEVLSEEKVVRSLVLNRLGLQVARTIVAHAVYHLHKVETPSRLVHHVDALRRDGLLVLHDFLPASEFDALRSEYFDAYDRYREQLFTANSTNLYEMAYFHRLPPDGIPHARRFVDNPMLHQLLEGGERRSWAEFFHFSGLEYITYGETGDPDPQVTLHADAFYHTHKAWLYIEDVRPEDGPLAVVKGTHRFTLRQIPHIYSHSLETGVDPSRRIESEEMRRAGLQETLVTCPKNTLVIANTGAYHRRTPGKPGARRYAIQVVARANPFVFRTGMVARTRKIFAKRSSEVA